MNYERLREKLLACRECAGVEGLVVGPMVQGHRFSRIMQISQAPSLQSSGSGRLFDDASGRRLVFGWYQIDYGIFHDPDNFYITSLSRCYPGKDQRGRDRPPSLACARKWLLPEMEQVQNRLYVIIGSRAARFLIPDIGFEELVFQGWELNGKPVLVLPHPSPLNNRWFARHRWFEHERLPRIRGIVHRALGVGDGA